MKDLVYRIAIQGPRERVWRTLIQKDSYDRWVRAFSPHSTFQGEWKEGNEMLFWDPDCGGTAATVEQFRPHDLIALHHTGTVNKDGVKETKGEMAEKWIGSQEVYRLTEEGGGTRLEVTMTTDAVFEDLFNQGWPKALENIKQLVENPV